jgi:hypothetical protein
VPDVIDIAGFTRITENSIRRAVDLSGLQIREWTAIKEYTDENRPRMHLYVELEREAIIGSAVHIDLLREQLGAYFKYLDSDYKDLKKILGVDPLEITVVKCDTFASYQARYGAPIRRINPSARQIANLLALA